MVENGPDTLDERDRAPPEGVRLAVDDVLDALTNGAAAPDGSVDDRWQ